jgi:hypothetical protein
MNKGILGLAVLVTLVLLVGCRPTVSTPQPTPSRYWTALEAYEQIRPTMIDWHEDARVTRISAIGNMQRNGTAAWWGFGISSPAANRATIITLEQEDIFLGIDGIAGREISMDTDRGLPIDTIIDSVEAVAGALENGVSDDSILLDIWTTTYEDASDGNSPSWRLTFATPDNLSQEYQVFVNIVTGEVIHNDFTYTPPPPTFTPIREARPDQLVVSAYGEFDMYITDPREQSLGIEPGSGEQIREIPDAGYDPDSDIMTEDSIHLASALIMNPVEGRYRLHLHGPGEQEKRCRLSVEAIKGTGEEVLREVEIPCQGGVSLVYEFTLTLSGEELLSEVILVQE